MAQALKKTKKKPRSILQPTGHSLTSEEKRNLDFSESIVGWGSDLSREVRPGVPKDKAPEIGVDYLYPEIEQQIPRAKVHMSTEHAQLTPVFGNACPPRGVSGAIRNYAYTLSEGRLSHWLLLVVADRVDMVEEIFRDLSQLKIPNIPNEMGLASEWKYNRRGVVKKATLAGVGLLAFMVFRKARRMRIQY
jgi:hypothetical protein